MSGRALASFVFTHVKQSVKSSNACRQQACMGGLSFGDMGFLRLGAGGWKGRVDAHQAKLLRSPWRGRKDILALKGFWSVFGGRPKISD